MHEKITTRINLIKTKCSRPSAEKFKLTINGLENKFLHRKKKKTDIAIHLKNVLDALPKML